VDEAGGKASLVSIPRTCAFTGPLSHAWRHANCTLTMAGPISIALPYSRYFYASRLKRSGYGTNNTCLKHFFLSFNTQFRVIAAVNFLVDHGARALCRSLGTICAGTGVESALALNESGRSADVACHTRADLTRKSASDYFLSQVALAGLL
jgi:hypothetical protein